MRGRLFLLRGIHKDMAKWAISLGPLLKRAEHSSNPPKDGWVWESDVVPFLKEFESDFTPQLASLGRYLEKEDSPAAQVAIETCLEPPGKARIDYGIQDFDFQDHPTLGSQIVYKKASLEKWARAFLLWVEGSSQVLSREIRSLKV